MRHLINRRQFIRGAAAFAGFTAAVACSPQAPSVQTGGKRSLKVGTFGGFFEEAFVKNIYPEFTKATGIEIESVPTPAADAWYTQLETAARANQAPTDLSMMAQIPMLRGQASDLWTPFDLERMPNAKYLKDNFIHRYPDGRVDGIGAASWYITFVTNKTKHPTAPTSWSSLWDEQYRNQLGMNALPTGGFLLDITAATFFGGSKILETQDGILQVLNKAAEIKPNVKLWYRDEAQFQQALETGELAMGQYYHDVSVLKAKQGKPILSTFTKEGGINDSGCWVMSRPSKKLEEAYVFMDYMCQPEIQAKLARNVGVAPVVDRKDTDLTDAEFNAVASDISPIIPAYRTYMEQGDWIAQKWTEMITS